MIKRLSVILLATAMLAFAQDPYSSDPYAPAPTEETQYEDMSAYTSGAPAPETPLVTINEVASSDPVFFVSLHPITMLFWWGLFNMPTINLTIEGCVGPTFAIITRPMLLFWNDSRSLGYDDEDLSLWDVGVTEGIRYYFGAHHKGLYVEPQFIYEHVGIEYSYDNNDDLSVSANMFGGAVVVGYKILSGHFTMASDLGFAYTTISVSGKYKDDAEEVSSVGAGLTGSFSLGYAF